MKLAFIEVSGFRGFRDKFRLDIPHGFAVISGRNGVGKSTLIDAVEFALTGTISKYKGEKTDRETIADYLWWRGEGAAASHYVTAGFIDDEGSTFALTRSREGGLSNQEQARLRKIFGDDPPEDALELLCNTSIIRDELIAKSSFEISESDRFRFVSSAMGSVKFEDDKKRAIEVQKATKIAETEARREYDAQRERVAQLLQAVARAKDQSSRGVDLTEAGELLAQELGLATDTVMNLVEVRSRLAVRRAEIASLRDVAIDLRDFAPRIAAVKSPEFDKEIADKSATLSGKKQELQAAENDLRSAEINLQRERDANEMAAALASLLRLGTRVGLVDGHCPLCDTELNDLRFEAGIHAAERRLGNAAKALRVADASLSRARQRASELARNIGELELAINAAKTERLQCLEREQKIRTLLVEQGIEALTLSAEVVSERVDVLSSGLLQLERSLRLLELSQSVARVSEVEAELLEARKSAEIAEATYAKATRATVTARELEHTVNRASNEILDERLAELSPLLSELYQRLRPHNDWRNIEYRLRGDIRRFLSLSVGEDLNPQFLFSSGQRRVAGLAFLLAVYLSRSWTSWKSLLLDDPVQHIDDYRALNLVEVLAAIRREDGQVICAVEDEALGELLARRLRSSFDAPGCRYVLGLGADGCPMISSVETVRPMAVKTLSGAAKADAS